MRAGCEPPRHTGPHNRAGTTHACNACKRTLVVARHAGVDLAGWQRQPIRAALGPHVLLLPPPPPSPLQRPHPPPPPPRRRPRHRTLLPSAPRPLPRVPLPRAACAAWSSLGGALGCAWQPPSCAPTGTAQQHPCPTPGSWTPPSAFPGAHAPLAVPRGTWPCTGWRQRPQRRRGGVSGALVRPFGPCGRGTKLGSPLPMRSAAAPSCAHGV